MLGWEVIPRIPLENLSVSPHGVGIAVGYFLGATLMARRARRTGFDEDHAWNAAVVGVLGAIVGARLAYIIGHSAQFQSPIEYLQIYKGGISLMGGLLGGFLAAYIYCRVKNLDFARLADLGAPGLAIGTAVGRIGDLVIGDHLGRTTSGFWGWEYKGGELISPPPCDPSIYPSPDGCIRPGMVVHQTALYDAIWALIIFLVLMVLSRKPRPNGFLVLTWAALYSAGRIITDFTRVDKTWFGTGLTGSQLTAIAVLGFSLVGLTKLRGSAKAAPAGAIAGDEVTIDSGSMEPTAVEVPATEPVLEPTPKSKREPGPVPVLASDPAPEPLTASGRDAEQPLPEDSERELPGPPGAAGVLTDFEEAEAPAPEVDTSVEVIESLEVPAEPDLVEPSQPEIKQAQAEERQEP